MHLLALLSLQIICVLALAVGVASLECDRGEFDNGSACVECPAGTYQDKTGQNSCIKCPSGSFGRFTGTQSRDLCEQCGDDAISDPGATECSKCPAGQKAVLDGDKCVSCPPGTFISFSGCATCEFDSISTKQNTKECTECPKYFVPNGSKTKCVFLNCPPGKEFDSGTCEDCFADTFKGPGMDMCETCPQGSLAGFGFTKCVKCDVGQRVINNGFGLDCESCPAGTTTFKKGAILCRIDMSKCPSPYFETKARDCNSCEPGFKYVVAKRKCLRCKKGEIGAGGLTTNCIKCTGGRVPKDNKCLCPGGRIFKNGECRKCPAGTFRQDFQDDDECFPCDPAEQFSKKGSEDCGFCPSGTNPSADASKCIPEVSLPFCPDVPPGTKCRSPKTGCPVGKTRAIRGGKPACFSGPSFMECAPGEIAICEDNSGKVDCPPGRVFDGDRRCISCSFGHFLAPNGKCNECADNEVSPGGLVKSCSKCPSGLKAARDDKRICVCSPQAGGVDSKGKCRQTCPAGTEPVPDFRNTRNGDRCVTCPAGTFSSAGDFTCSSCPKNQTSKPGASKCKPCPLELITYGIGDPQCQPLLPKNPKKCVEMTIVKSCLARKGGARCTVIRVQTKCKRGKADKKQLKKTMNKSCSLVRECFIDTNLVIGD